MNLLAEVGTYYITIMPDMSKFTGGVNKALGNAGIEGGKSYSKSFADVLKGSAIGTALGNLATRAGSAIVSGLQTGIDRSDTLRNFPRVMEAMGFSASDAEAQIQKIMTRLRGLPASTQDVVRLTQAISDSTGDLGLATDASLAFTDAMIAQGASAGEITQAQGVLNRVLGKGSATVAQWGSLTSVMTPQLNAVAKSLLGAGASAEELHTALEDGTVTWDDFLRAMVDLDQNGLQVAGRDMASFEQQARANSDGIGTAIENMAWRIGTGWANIISAIGTENISGPINGIADAISNGMTKVGDGISYIRKAIAKTDIAKNAAKVFKDIGDAIGGLWSDEDAENLKSMTDALVGIIDGAFKWLADHGDAVKTAVGGIVGALAALAGWKIGTDLAALPATFTALTAALAANPFALIVGGLAAATMALYTFFTQTETGKQLWSDFCTIMSDLWAGLQQDWANLCAVLSQEWESFKAFIDGIPAWWQGIMDYWSNAMSEQANNFKVSWDKIKGDFSAAWDAIKTAAAQKWDEIKTKASTTAETIRTTVSQKWDAIKTSTSEKWEGIKSSVATTAESIRTAVSDKFNAAKDAALNVFENLKNGIVDKLNWAKNTMAGIVNSIKGLFNFSWSLPRPKLPYIRWHWESVGGMLNIPWFDGVEWYANGGVFDTASIIGIGEAGKEAALPLNDRTYREIAKGVVGEMGGTVPPILITGNEFNVRDDDDIDRIAERLSDMIIRQIGAAA